MVHRKSCQHTPARTGRQNKQEGKKMGARKGSDAGCLTCTQRAPSHPGQLGVRAHSCPTHGHQHLPFTRNGFGITKPALPLLMMFNFNFFKKMLLFSAIFCCFTVWNASSAANASPSQSLGVNCAASRY